MAIWATIWATCDTARFGRGCARWPGRLRRVAACALARLARCLLWPGAGGALCGLAAASTLSPVPLSVVMTR
jgi:hypothetical protein